MDYFLGGISIFAGNFAPRNWALCNGQILPISQNTALFSLLGTYYGGNGTSTFGLPNLQGRATVHPGQSAGTSLYVIGQASGTTSVTLAQSQMPIHTHSASGIGVTAVSIPGNTTVPTGNYLAASRAVTSAGYAAAAVSPGAVVAMNSNSISGTLAVEGGGLPVSIVQPVLALTYIIATSGIFPTRN
jgi:microcystin-dependent protein